jgi:primosomal protein N'
MIVDGIQILSEQDRNRLLVIVAIFIIFLSGYSAYSVGKYKALGQDSLVASNLVMKAIAHNVFCVCPKCGTKGIPMCPVCHIAMYWNGYRGIFICPACGKSGFPVCPRCNHQMTLIESM